MVTSPHHLASAAGARVLEAGGTATEAAVATAAALAVVYPHMNSIGGDGFWLIAEPGRPPVGIDACGRAAGLADLGLYERAGMSTIPWRGGLAANTMAGTVSGWNLALRTGASSGMSLAALLEDAIAFAADGAPVTEGFVETVAAKRDLAAQPGFSAVFGQGLQAGELLRQPALAQTLRRLADQGLDDFYRGDLARDMALDLEEAGSPLRPADFQDHAALSVTPLTVTIEGAQLYNLPSPTQGLASLLILALFDRQSAPNADGFAHIHGLVEATKQAFKVRDRFIGDPQLSSFDAQGLLNDVAALDRMAAAVSLTTAAPWPQPQSGGDTVWLGVVDSRGAAVSMIQSTYFEFGSGLVLPRTGVTWQNRGCSFRLSGAGPNVLRPRAKPFHTLNPAMAIFDDGRRMVYGTMGGEGQPQTQAAIFSRYARYGQDLQDAVSAPRWLLGRTWGDDSTALRLEGRFAPDVVEALRGAGHPVEITAPFTSVMGHAGAIVRHADGRLEGASDPRSDGAAIAAFTKAARP